MISVIVPVYNEEFTIENTIARLRNTADNDNISEIIIVDGGSKDRTLEIAGANGATIIIANIKGRAAQMNAGAKKATGGIFYFLHADSLPPVGFTSDILQNTKNGYTSGCFRLAFDYDHWFLNACSWCTRFDVNAVRFGDQSLFISRELFFKIGGFNESLLMMEDQEIIHRLKKFGKFVVMKGEVITAARKYLENGIIRLQWIFTRIWLMYYLGASQQKMVSFYRAHVKNSKL